MNDENQAEQNIEKKPNAKKGFITWVKANKILFIIAGISIPLTIAIVLGLKNKEAIKELFGKLVEDIKKRNFYSSKWFENATDADLNSEREKIRLAFCSSGDDYETAAVLQRLLWRFDEEIRNRAYGNRIPCAPSIHREHGWYLPNDD